MDEPSVNLSYLHKLEVEPQRKNKQLIMLARVHHTTPNDLLDSLEALTDKTDTDVDQIVLDLLGFLKHSAKHV